MNLPFYETGKIQKNTPTTKDIEKTASLIKKIKPHQIYAAGDLEDPHGTHTVSYTHLTLPPILLV